MSIFDSKSIRDTVTTKELRLLYAFRNGWKRQKKSSGYRESKIQQHFAISLNTPTTIRLFKPGGRIWVQLPWVLPYHEHPKDYWRVSPDGLKLWMHEFKEVACAAVTPRGTALTISSYFVGEK